MRDDFSVFVKETLAKRVAYRCSRPGCDQVTAGPQDDPARSINLGVAAHITAASPGGARYDPTLSQEERCSPANGIWLCQKCGKLVDNDEHRYPVSLLREWKAHAEDLAKQALEGRGPTSAPLVIECHAWMKKPLASSTVILPFAPEAQTRGLSIELTEYFLVGSWPRIPYESAPFASINRWSVTNYGSAPVFKVSFMLRLNFREAVAIVEGTSRFERGNITTSRDWPININKIDPGADSAFIFYAANRSLYFLDIIPPESATLEVFGETLQRTVPIRLTDRTAYGLGPGLAPLTFTQEGVLEMQLRIAELVKRLAREKRVLLDPGGLTFFDGSMELPKPGIPWKVTLRSRGKCQTVVLTVDELTNFKAGHFFSTVPHDIGMALDQLAA